MNANLSEIREQRQRSTWEFALHRAQDAVSYTDMYYSKLKGEPLSTAEQVFRFEFSTVLINRLIFDLFRLLKFKICSSLETSLVLLQAIFTEQIVF